MLITSDFFDYYDSASAYGIDKTVVYRRKENILAWEKPASNSWIDELSPPISEQFSIKRHGHNISYEIFKFYVGFCGTIHPVLEVKKILPEKTESFYFYTADECLDFLKQEKIGLGKTKTRYYFNNNNNYSINSEIGVKGFFSSSNKYTTIFETIFRENNCPVFIFGQDLVPSDSRSTKIILNPSLKKIKFAKVKDPVSAFQDIYMFISGVLGTPEKPMIEISDKDKAAAKGHDGPYSFKKPPTGRWR